MSKKSDILNDAVLNEALDGIVSGKDDASKAAREARIRALEDKIGSGYGDYRETLAAEHADERAALENGTVLNAEKRDRVRARTVEMAEDMTALYALRYGASPAAMAYAAAMEAEHSEEIYGAPEYESDAASEPDGPAPADGSLRSRLGRTFDGLETDVVTLHDLMFEAGDVDYGDSRSGVSGLRHRAALGAINGLYALADMGFGNAYDGPDRAVLRDPQEGRGKQAEEWLRGVDGSSHTGKEGADVGLDR